MSMSCDKATPGTTFISLLAQSSRVFKWKGIRKHYLESTLSTLLVDVANTVVHIMWHAAFVATSTCPCTLCIDAQAIGPRRTVRSPFHGLELGAPVTSDRTIFNTETSAHRKQCRVRAQARTLVRVAKAAALLQ
eukprot:2072353-Amphidinium_carterae.1